MAIIGTLLKRGISIGESIDQEYSSPYDLQKLELKKLLIAASHTAFGHYYSFDRILEQFRNPGKYDFFNVFKQRVPVNDYNSIYNKWWYRNRNGEKHICWPGKIKYFALSSGTSESSSKYIPITKEMLKGVQRTSIRQILTLSKYDLPDRFFETGILMLGGSTHLNYNGTYFEGDLSGITTSQLPFWFQHFNKLGQKIARTRNWEEKLDEITRKAPSWDIGVIAGVPAWIQILLEKILDRYQVEHIHKIWPNLKIYVHGGVSFDPYKKGFKKLLGEPLYYIETYMASEGFIAFQAFPQRRSMRMVLNNGIFYEFIPFNEENFDQEGNLLPDPETLMIEQIEENKEYALLLSTNAGTWRYLIGDVIKFVSKEESEIVITGRTKHFLSLCGEHLSLDNMNKAIELVSDELNVNVKEFTISGIPYKSLFAHHWYIGTDDQVSAEEFKIRLDQKLKLLNDDYRVERSAALKDLFVDIIPTRLFYNWMKLIGKEGGQNKFPRVLKASQYAKWKCFVEAKDNLTS
ncbi:MAG: GH3 auxin-responsive promoter family protein [Bacteroidetes bacterium]|nr:GH3 auxin-responsive promoter family protein [Bacteroidota bacterium]